MRYIADTVDFELKEPTVVTLGKFDGRHRGHQKLLRTMEEVKESLGYATAIFTFSTAPLTLVTGEIATVITTSEERRHNMEKMGIDYLVEYPFTDDVRKMDPAVFVIGGGVSKAGEVLLSFIEKPFMEKAFFANKNVKFKLATLGNDAGICGAAKLVLED